MKKELDKLRQSNNEELNDVKRLQTQASTQAKKEIKNIHHYLKVKIQMANVMFHIFNNKGF